MTDAAAKTVTVTVTDDSGVLSAEVTSPDKTGIFTFVNQYAPDKSVTAAPITVEKTVSGSANAPQETFRFLLEAIGYEGDADISAAVMPMPEGGRDGSLTMQRTGAGSVDFGSIVFAQPGIYRYQLTELAGTNSAFAYDKSRFTLTYTVSRVSGKMSCTFALERDGETAESIAFDNVYTRPSTRPGSDPQTTVAPQQTPVPPVNLPSDTPPRTGDSNRMWIWIAAALASVAGLIGMGFLYRRKER